MENEIINPNNLDDLISNLNKKLEYFQNQISEMELKLSFKDDELKRIKEINKALLESHKNERLIWEKKEEEFRKQQKILVQNETRRTEWELIIDEMAHSFNTDLFIAQDAILHLEDSPNKKIAFEHLKHIRELNDLIMWYLKRNDFFRKDDTTVKIDIREVYHKQLQTVKEGITTLRLSVKEHQEKLKTLLPQYNESGDCSILITKPLAKVCDLIIKDLLKNAFKNTNDENPEVSVTIQGNENEVMFRLTNNSLMPLEFKQWFVGDADIEPSISKSSKVGLRIIKRWLTLLRIDYNVELNETNDSTTVVIYIPKEVKID